MNRLEPGVDFWHQEVRWTWLKQGIGLYVVFAFYLFFGISEIALAVVLTRDHRFSLAATWMGAKPCFRWVLAFQMAGAGLFAVFAAGNWLRRRSGLQLLCAFSCSWMAAFLGPSHEPTESGIASVFWIFYATKTMGLVFWLWAYFANPFLRSRQGHKEGS